MHISEELNIKRKTCPFFSNYRFEWSEKVHESKNFAMLSCLKQGLKNRTFKLVERVHDCPLLILRSSLVSISY